MVQNAKTPDEKLIAYAHRILCLTSETSDFGKGAEIGLEILKKYGFDIPLSPTKSVMAKEEMKYKLALRNRSISCLTTLPIKDDPLLDLCAQLNLCTLCKFVCTFCLRRNTHVPYFPHQFSLFCLPTYRFWEAGRHEAVELEDNPVFSEEGKHKLKFSTYHGGFCIVAREAK